jgi:hypothetical protein
MIIISQKENLQKRIKAVTVRLQLLTESKEDKVKREELLFSLRDLQREISIYL